ncbi:3-hydroxyacyl-CoA dehydrogenase family protein [Baekduia soli]|uniref:3-hydroxyacyl-CoA dehydrogenase family protein n=1 Tax=Baekduia soli TaxID=496014 RepID=A0A5B8UBZ1_9ACTN|nr:3-hydroxyacyl-CoA dehydrogenase family protein [Baekduia soli]QEC50565.1 3-hydroxyacyl-CoA dehydrogenase family protein [Baekduia soli]
MDTNLVGVVGCGAMGHGIAQITAQAGLGVVVCERGPEPLEAGLARIDASLARLEAKGGLDGSAADVRARIAPTVDVADLADCDLVIEAVDEDLATKLGVWRAVAPLLGPDAVCATNTSSLSVIDQAVVTDRPDRFIGLHFFNPPQMMSLLEVVGSVASSDAAVAVGLAYGRRLGRDVVQAPDRAGFLVNRLLLPYVLDAVRAMEGGFGTIADIDLGMRKGTGHPMGPFTLLDFVGLDVVMAMTDVMFEEYHETRFSAPPTLRKLVAAGFTGRKSGRGFYDYATEPPTPLDAPRPAGAAA